MRYEYILVGEDAGLAIVTMNRPERRNALSEAHMTELIRALRTIGDAAEARAVVLGAVDAASARAGGLVNRGVARERLEEETRACARAASRGSTASKGHGKRAYYETIEIDVATAYARACEVMATSAVTEDGREMMRAFLEKRTAVYPPRR